MEGRKLETRLAVMVIHPEEATLTSTIKLLSQETNKPVASCTPTVPRQQRGKLPTRIAQRHRQTRLRATTNLTRTRTHTPQAQHKPRSPSLSDPGPLFSSPFRAEHIVFEGVIGGVQACSWFLRLERPLDRPWRRRHRVHRSCPSEPPLRCSSSPSPSPRWCRRRVRALDFSGFLFSLFFLLSRSCSSIHALLGQDRLGARRGLVLGIQGRRFG